MVPTGCPLQAGKYPVPQELGASVPEEATTFGCQWEAPCNVQNSFPSFPWVLWRSDLNYVKYRAFQSEQTPCKHIIPEVWLPLVISSLFLSTQ